MSTVYNVWQYFFYIKEEVTTSSQPFVQHKKQLCQKKFASSLFSSFTSVTTVITVTTVTTIIVKYQLLLLYSSQVNFFIKVVQQIEN